MVFGVRGCVDGMVGSGVFAGGGWGNGSGW